MKTEFFNVVGVFITFNSCKKENNYTIDIDETIYVRHVISPPPGYLFPRKFNFNLATANFSVYNNKEMLTNPSLTPQKLWDMFDKIKPEFIGEIILLDKNNMKIGFLEKEGIQNINYLFTQDSLIIKLYENSETIEFPIAKGNYNGFGISTSFKYYSYNSDTSNGSYSIVELGTYANLNNTINEFNLQNVNQLKTTDTLAFANKTFYYN